MICGHDRNDNHDNHDNFSGDSDCIVSTLLSVAEAQEKVEDDCRSGCQQAIDELKGRSKARNFDTIPVLLTCNCSPFSAAGALRSKNGEDLFKVISSFLFRVNDVDEETGCAALELLLPVTNHEGKEEEFKKNRGRHESAFGQFLEDLDNAKKIVRTGICVTVDLDNITSVSCLPPIHTV